MELILAEMHQINTFINGKVRTDRGKGKAKEIPEPPPVNQTLESEKPKELGATATRNPEKPEVAEEGARLVKRPLATREGSSSKGTPDPIAKRTRAGTGNPKGTRASPAVAEKPDRQPHDGEHEKGEEYNLRKTPGGSAAEPLGI